MISDVGLNETSSSLVQFHNSSSASNDQLIELYTNEMIDKSKNDLALVERNFLELEAMDSKSWLPSLIKCHNIEHQIDNLLEQLTICQSYSVAKIVASFMFSIMRKRDLNASFKLSDFKMTHSLCQCLKDNMWCLIYLKNKKGKKYKEDILEQYLKVKNGQMDKSKLSGMDWCTRKANLIKKGINEIIDKETLNTEYFAKFENDISPSDEQAVWIQNSVSVFKDYKAKVSEVKMIDDTKGGEDSNMLMIDSYIRPNAVTDTATDADNDDDEDALYKDKVIELDEVVEENKIDGFQTAHQLICKEIENVNGNAGSHGIHEGIDGSISSKFIEMIINLIQEYDIGVGVDFGSGTGVTAAIIAEFTNLKMICIEHNHLRYFLAMMGQLRLLDSGKCKNILNVKHYFNGDVFNEAHTKLINDSANSKLLENVMSMNGVLIQDNLNCKSFPPHLMENTSLENIGLAYFFTLGWDKADIKYVISYINQLKNLKFLIVDLSLKCLINYYDFKLFESIKTIHKIKNCKLIKSTNTRVFYVFEMVNINNVINPDSMDFIFKPIDRNDISKSVKYLEFYMNYQKNNRSRAKTSFFTPVDLIPPKKKRILKKSKNIEEIDSSESDTDSTDNISKEDLLVLLAFREKYDIKEVPYPQNCIELGQKVKFAKSYKQKTKLNATTNAHNNNSEKISPPNEIQNSDIFAKVMETLRSNHIDDDVINQIGNDLSSMSIGSGANNNNNNNNNKRKPDTSRFVNTNKKSKVDSNKNNSPAVSGITLSSYSSPIIKTINNNHHHNNRKALSNITTKITTMNDDTIVDQVFNQMSIDNNYTAKVVSDENLAHDFISCFDDDVTPKCDNIIIISNTDDITQKNELSCDNIDNSNSTSNIHDNSSTKPSDKSTDIQLGVTPINTISVSNVNDNNSTKPAIESAGVPVGVTPINTSSTSTSITNDNSSTLPAIEETEAQLCFTPINTSSNVNNNNNNNKPAIESTGVQVGVTPINTSSTSTSITNDNSSTLPAIEETEAQLCFTPINTSSNVNNYNNNNKPAIESTGVQVGVTPINTSSTSTSITNDNSSTLPAIEETEAQLCFAPINTSSNVNNNNNNNKPAIESTGVQVGVTPINTSSTSTSITNDNKETEAEFGVTSLLHDCIYYSPDYEYGMPGNAGMKYSEYLITKLSVMWFFYRQIEEFKLQLTNQFPEFSSIFSEMINGRIHNIDAAHSILKLFPQLNSCQDVSSVNNMIMRLYKPISVETNTQLFRINFVTKGQCSICKNVSKQSSDYLDTITIKGDITDNSVLNCFNKEQIESFCEICSTELKSQLITSKEIIHAPLVLVISSAELKSNLNIWMDEKLDFGNCKYILKAVIYGNSKCFIARYTNSNNDLYEFKNDNMMSGNYNSMCKEIKMDNQKRKKNRFPSNFKIKNKKFSIQECYYVKNDFLNSNSSNNEIELKTWGISEERRHVSITFSSDIEYGFPYDNLSCAWDSLLTFFWTQYRSSAIFRAHYNSQSHEVATVFEKMMLSSLNNIDAKDEIITKLDCLEKISGSFNEMHYVKRVHESVISEPSKEFPTRLLRTVFRFKYECKECKAINEEHYDVNDIFISEDIYMKISDTKATNVIQETINYYLAHLSQDKMKTPLRSCSHPFCSIDSTISKTDCPLVFVIVYSLFKTPKNKNKIPKIIDNQISFGDSNYILKGVIYGNGQHFILKYKNGDDIIFDYDDRSLISDDFSSNSKRFNDSHRPYHARCQESAIKNFPGKFQHNNTEYVINEIYYVKDLCDDYISSMNKNANSDMIIDKEDLSILEVLNINNVNNSDDDNMIDKSMDIDGKAINTDVDFFKLLDDKTPSLLYCKMSSNLIAKFVERLVEHTSLQFSKVCKIEYIESKKQSNFENNFFQQIVQKLKINTLNELSNSARVIKYIANLNIYHIFVLPNMDLYFRDNDKFSPLQTLLQQISNKKVLLIGCGGMDLDYLNKFISEKSMNIVFKNANYLDILKKIPEIASLEVEDVTESDDDDDEDGSDSEDGSDEDEDEEDGGDRGDDGGGDKDEQDGGNKDGKNDNNKQSASDGVLESAIENIEEEIIDERVQTTDGTIMTKEDVRSLLTSSRTQNIAVNELNAFREVLQASRKRKHETVINKYDTDITITKLKCLRPNIWLNDEVINFYMLMLQERDEHLCKLYPERTRSHFFSSFFIHRLVITDGKYNFANVRKWTKKFDAFSMDKIFFPINITNTHWTLAVILMKLRQIHYYDSMGGPGNMYLKGLLCWLIREAREKKKPTVNPQDWNLVMQELHVPQQSNGDDCGVFTTICADYISDDLPLAYNQQMMLFFREKIGTDIMRGRLLYPDVTMRMDKRSNINLRPAFLNNPI